MAFTIIREDLARVHVDAIVVPASPTLLPDGGAAYEVARAAGYRRVRRACKRLGGCAVGNAAATPAYDLPAAHIIHAVGPVWQGGAAGEAQLLRSAYDSALNLALRLNAQSVAMPLLSAGTFGYPVREAFEIAVAAIRGFLETADLDVLLVLYDKRAVIEGSRLFGQVAEYVDDAYVDEHAAIQQGFRRGDRPGRLSLESQRMDASASAPASMDAAAEPGDTGAFPAVSAQAFCLRCGKPVSDRDSFCMHCGISLRHADAMPTESPSASMDLSVGVDSVASAGDFEGSSFAGAASMPLEAAGGHAPKTAARRREPRPKVPKPAPSAQKTVAPDLGTLLANMDDSFSTMLMRLIDARGLTDAQVYKRANISRQHFSKMRNPGYRPTKKTVVALAVALELSLDDARDLLSRAGFALSHSSKFDIIVEYFIRRGDYDIFAINETLFAYDQPLLG